MDNILDKRRRKRLREIAFDFNNKVSPGDLLDKLPCISLQSDMQRIRRYTRNEGDTTANRELCSCLVGKTGWYDQLIEGLEEIGPVEILEMMKSDKEGSLLSPTPVVRSTVCQTTHRISENQPPPSNRRSISEDTPVSDLPAGVRAALRLLDQDVGISHSWEDLADCFGMTWEERNWLATLDNRSARLVERWYQKNPSQANLGNLISRLCSIERLDVVSKIKEVITQEDGAGSNRQLSSQQEQENFCQSIEKHHHYENNLKGGKRQKLDLKDQSDALQKWNSSTRTSPGTHFNSDGMKTVNKQPMPVQGHPPQQSHRPPDNRMRDPSRDLMKEPLRATSGKGHARQEEKNQKRSMVNYETKASYPSVNMPGMETSFNNSTAKPHSACKYGSEPQQNNTSLVQQREPTAASKLGMAGNIGPSPQQANRNRTEHDAGTVKFDKSENTPQGPQSVSSPSSPVAPKSQPVRGQKGTTSSSETGAENVSPGRTPSATPKRLNAEAAENIRPRPPSGNLPVSRVTPPSSPVKELMRNIRSSETCTDNVSPPRLTPKSTPEKGSDVSTKKENCVQLGNSNNGFSDTNDLGSGHENSKTKVEVDISSSSPKSLASTDVFLCQSEDILMSEASSSDSIKLEASQPLSTTVNPRNEATTMTAIPENQIRDVGDRGEKKHAENISQSEATDHNRQQTTTISVEDDEKAYSLVKNSRDDKMVETPGVGLQGEHFVRGREEEKVTSGISEMQTKDKLKSEEPDDIPSCSVRDIKRGGDITTLNQVGHLDNHVSNTPSHEEGDFKIHPLTSQEAGPRKETDYGPNIDCSNKTVVEKNKSKGIPQTTADRSAEVLETNDNNANETQEVVGRVEPESQQATSSDCGPQPLRSSDPSGVLWHIIFKMGHSTLDMSFGNSLANQY
ncbi:uncharacterized protein [Apostichopus japonicus]|uniref:uncharacterized protein isoform X2 n=1 Tax=Stichopus japonicus TaxID=307972 RepID=UPI003AB866BA